MQLVRHRFSKAIAALVVAFAALQPFSAPSAHAAVVAVGLRQVGQSGHAGIYGWGAATLNDGSVLLGDYWNYAIYHYSKDGQYLGTVVSDANAGLNPGQHQSPYGIAVDPSNNNVYFGDVDNNDTVDKYDLNGNFLLEWGGKGTTTGKYQYPSQVAVDPIADASGNHNVYVADQWAHHVVAVDPNGHELFRWGTQGTANGQFKQPRGLAFDPTGRLYVVDNYNLRVQVFDQQGNFLFKFGSKGTGPGQFNPGADLRGLAIDSVHGWVYVVDAAGGWIDKYDLNGNFLLRFGGFGAGDDEFSGGGRDLTVDGDGNVWVGDMPDFRFQKFDSNGNLLSVVPDPPEPPPDGGFNQPRGVAVDTNGNIFVTDTNNWRIEKFDSAGNFVTAWGHRNGEEPDGMGFNYARGIAVDPNTNDVLVADTDNHLIKRFDNNGNLIWQEGGFGTNPGQFKNPNSVFVGSDGEIYVSDTNNFRVQVLAPDGTPLRMFGSKGNGNGQFQFPRGIVADSDGSIWVADSIREIVQHFSATGTYLGQVGTPGSADNQLLRPDGIRVDANNVYVADSDQDQIKVWSKTGTFLGAFGSTGNALGQFQRPHGIDLTPDGHLWVVEQAGERVQELAISFTSPDTTPPTGTVASPTTNQQFAIANPVVFSGTISDNQAVGGVQLDIKNKSTGLWWHSDGTWSSSLQWQNATLDTPGAPNANWSYPWTAPASDSYSVFVHYRDAAGNSGTNVTIPFNVVPVIDSVPPTGTITNPTANQQFAIANPVPIGGTINDNIGVGSVQVAIRDTVSGLYWHSDNTFGSAFQWLNAGVTNPGSTSSPWSFSWSAPATGSYSVQARFVDGAGNIGATKPTAKFSVVTVIDTTAPTGAITSPARNQVFSVGNPITFQGTIADDQSAGSVGVAIKNTATGLFLQTNGTFTSTFTWLGASLDTPGSPTANWSFVWTPTSAGSYSIQARFLDTAGNVGATKPTVPFRAQ